MPGRSPRRHSLRILRLGLSDDTYGSLDEPLRSWSLAAITLEERTGEHWETVLAPNWPGERQAAELEDAITRLEPQLVLLCGAAYWVSYPSIPLRIRRKSFPGAKQLSRFGFWSARQHLIADRAMVHAARHLFASAQATGFYFEPQQAAERMERAIRTVLRHEHIALAVRGPLPLTISGPVALQTECERRRAAFDSALGALCDSLHVAYRGFSLADRHPRDELLGDRIHVNAKGHARRAAIEAGVMLRAWDARLRE